MDRYDYDNYDTYDELDCFEEEDYYEDETTCPECGGLLKRMSEVDDVYGSPRRTYSYVCKYCGYDRN